jgi:hypothetical protein
MLESSQQHKTIFDLPIDHLLIHKTLHGKASNSISMFPVICTPGEIQIASTLRRQGQHQCPRGGATQGQLKIHGYSRLNHHPKNCRVFL